MWEGANSKHWGEGWIRIGPEAVGVKEVGAWLHSKWRGGGECGAGPEQEQGEGAGGGHKGLQPH